MSNQEHYFENLLYRGYDNLNTYMLTQEEIDAIETCVQYVLWNIFSGKEDFLDFVNQRNDYEYLKYL